MNYLMEYIDSGKDPKDLDVIIGWSLVSRWEYYDEGWKGLTPNSVSNTQKSILLLWIISIYRKRYVRFHVGSYGCGIILKKT